MKTLLLGRLFFEPEPQQKLDYSEAPLLRSYITSLFHGEELLHNQETETGKSQARYPLIQYKVIHGNGLVLGIGEDAVDALHEISRSVRELRMQGKVIRLSRRCLDIIGERFGLAEQKYDYHWLTPWLALNQENSARYQAAATDEEREDLLSRCLIGNMMSASKYLDYTVPDKITMKLSACQAQQVTVKGETLIGFTGNFQTNFVLPDLIGLGKSCSLGFGCCAMSS
jgi:hypothetical protein